MPHTEYGDTMQVPLNRLELAVLRHALDTHEPKLEANIKSAKDLGVPNETAQLHLAVINGTEGWGQSLRSKLLGNLSLSEQTNATKGDQLSLADEQKKAEEQEERAKFEAARAELAGKLSTIPELSQAHPDYILRLVRSWTPEQDDEARTYLWSIEANPEAPKPPHVDALCDRIEEAQMSSEEVAFWLDYGPARVGQGIYENSTVAYFYAAVPGNDYETVFPPNFETLEEAHASAARINRSEWKLSNPEANATPWDVELARGASEVLTQETVTVPAENLGDITPKAKNRRKGEKVAEPETVAGD